MGKKYAIEFKKQAKANFIPEHRWRLHRVRVALSRIIDVIPPSLPTPPIDNLVFWADPARREMICCNTKPLYCAKPFTGISHAHIKRHGNSVTELFGWRLYVRETIWFVSKPFHSIR